VGHSGLSLALYYHAFYKSDLARVCFDWRKNENSPTSTDCEVSYLSQWSGCMCREVSSQN
jgi:hypothetical protein